MTPPFPLAVSMFAAAWADLGIEQRLAKPCHRFPAGIIAHAVWLYHRLLRSLREVEDLLAEREIDVSFQIVLEGP